MKKTTLFALFVILSVPLFAQYSDDEEQTFKFGVGTALSLPVGDFKQSADYGIGLELTGIYSLSDNLAAFAQAGVHVFRGSSSYYYGDNSSNVLHIPLLVGARFKFSGFFAGAGVGYGTYNVSGGDPASGFTYSPQAGYDFGKLQVMAHYTASAVTGGTLSYFGLKLFRTF